MKKKSGLKKGKRGKTILMLFVLNLTSPQVLSGWPPSSLCFHRLACFILKKALQASELRNHIHRNVAVDDQYFFNSIH